MPNIKYITDPVSGLTFDVVQHDVKPVSFKCANYEDNQCEIVDILFEELQEEKKINKKLLQQKDEIISNREKTIEKQKKYIEELKVMVDSWKELSEHHWNMAHDPNEIDTEVLCMIRKPYIKEIENLKMVNESNDLALKESEEIIAELKAHCKAVDDVNKKLRVCGNCKYMDPENGCSYDETFRKQKLESNSNGDCLCDKWEMSE